MTILKISSTVCAIAIFGILGGCNDTKSPTAPVVPVVTSRNVLMFDGFEYESDSLPQTYSQMMYQDGRGLLSTTTVASHSGTHSLTSDSSLTGIKVQGAFNVEDSIIGLEFFIMTKQLGQVSCFSALGRGGSAWNALFPILGMGIGLTDSLQYIYQYDPTAPDNVIKNIAAVQPNTWYKCNIECNYNDTTVSYSLNDNVVQTIKTPYMKALNTLLVARDSVIAQGAGSKGPKQYYIDDITVYKK